MNTKFNRGFAGVLVIVLIAIVVIGAAVYFYTKNKNVETPEVVNNISSQSIDNAITPQETGNNIAPIQTQTPRANIAKTETNPDVASSWKTYKNEQRKFSFNYPSDGKVSEIGGGITLTVSIDRPSTYSLYFVQQGRADDFSAYKVFSEKKIAIGGIQATERLVDTSGSGEITVSIEVKRYTGSDGLARSDSFGANFKNVDNANKALPEIEAIAKTLKYF